MAGRFSDDQVRCSFCHKTQDQVHKLIAGPDGVYICDEYVDICAEIIEEENEEELEIELKPKKKKKPKKPKRVIPLEQKYTLTGIGTTSLLLIAMIIQLLMSGE